MKITKTKRGYYQTHVYLGMDPVTGKKIEKCVSAKTKTACRQKANELLKNQEDVIRTFDAPKMTLSQFCQVWLDEYTLSFKPRARETAQSHIRTHINPAFGETALNAITPPAVQSFVNRLAEIRSPKTVMNVYGTLHQVFDTAVRIGYITTNPCTGTVLPKRPKPKLNPLDEEQVRTLLDSLPDDIYSDIITFDLFTGLRISELIALTWDRVDLEARTILIDRTLPRSPLSDMTFGTPKNNKSRIVPLPEQAVQTLRRVRMRQNEDRMRNAPYWQDYNLVFASPIGGKLAIGTIERKFKSRCPVEGVRFHDLRHTYATLSIISGVDYKSLSEALGHYSVAFTMDTYAFVSRGMRENHAEKLSRMFR